MTTTSYYTHIDTPLGKFLVLSDGKLLTGLYMPGHQRWQGFDAAWQQADQPFARLHEQLAEYFAGERQVFDVPLKLTGTAFQQKVWKALVRIQFGATVTYAELARRIGQPNAARAVGHANGRNPVSILVPCHRVIGSQRTLTGYAGGVEKKEWLLNWELSVKERRESREQPCTFEFSSSTIAPHSLTSPVTRS